MKTMLLLIAVSLCASGRSALAADPTPPAPPVRAAAVKAAPKAGCSGQKCGVAEVYCACHDREPDGGPERACFPTLNECQADLPAAAQAKVAARKPHGK